MWVNQGAGAVSNVPGTAAGDLLGLESTLVDLRPGVSGYKYDIEVDSETFGTGGNFNVLLLGSTDGGSTYASLHTPSFLQEISGGVRLHVTNFVNPNATTINRLKVQLQRNIAAASDLTYAPTMSALRVREYSGS
jgi:hypothetical protein